MNEEFKRRQDEVLVILQALSEMAPKPLVFIGGSAIQTAVLKVPKRLSVDLDLFYSDDIFPLLSRLGKEYKIGRRPAKREDLFSFCTVEKNLVKVKVDAARFELAQNKGQFRRVQAKAGSKAFAALVATPDYLLASKMSALAIGSTGRNPSLPLDFLKDVFDSNCLLDEFGLPENTADFLHEILATQNKIRGTEYTYERMLDDAMAALLASTATDDNKATVKKADLGNFLEYLFEPDFYKPEYWTMAYRLAAVLKILRTTKDGARKAFAEMEKSASRYTDGVFISGLERELAAKGVEKEVLQTLKIHAPKALVYLHCFNFPE